MALRNTYQEYGSFSRATHKLIFILVTAMLIVGSVMGHLDKPLKSYAYTGHKLTGLIVLCLGVLFLLWSLVNDKPQYPPKMANWQKSLARFVHAFMYLCLIVMPMSGWVMSTAAGHVPTFAGIQFALPHVPLDKALAHKAANIHFIVAWAFFGAIMLHVFGALVHQFYYKDNILKRMWVGKR